MPVLVALRKKRLRRGRDVNNWNFSSCGTRYQFYQELDFTKANTFPYENLYKGCHRSRIVLTIESKSEIFYDFQKTAFPMISTVTTGNVSTIDWRATWLTIAAIGATSKKGPTVLIKVGDLCFSCCNRFTPNVLDSAEVHLKCDHTVIVDFN